MPDGLKDQLEAMYGRKVSRRSAIRIAGGENVFRRILESGKYRTALEIGTYQGCSAAAMARWCQRVITIDLAQGQLESHGSPIARQELWDSLGLDNIAFHAVADDSEKTRLINELAFDFAFIDGAHESSAVRLDFSLVRRCGAVLFHDYTSAHVFNFVNKLGPVQVFDDFAFWTA